MYSLYYVVFLLTLARTSPRNWQPTDCPRQCSCVTEKTHKKVYCDIQGKEQLTAVPGKFPADSEYIMLKGNRISSINVGAFSNLTFLRHLDLASNELQSIPTNAFQHLTNLESLNLSKNRLRTLPSVLLRGMNSLQDLYLDGNVLQHLPKDFFRGLTSLRRLYLDSNSFYTLSDKLFGWNSRTTRTSPPTLISNLTSLVELFLNHNGIGEIQHDSFNKMSDLRRLKLNDNNITTLPRGIFRNLKSLRFLSLYKNPFQCTCSLKWLKDWIVQNTGYVAVFNPHLILCEGPPKLRGRGLLDVKDGEFECENDWGEWSNWENCSKLCDNGRQSRRRECKAGRRMCIGSETESRWCNTRKCGLDWSPWSVWTPCSVTCSVGYQTRSRSTQCSQSPCQRELKSELRACVRKECPSYTEWSSWSMCDTVCGAGSQVRKRKCTNSQPAHACPGSTLEIRSCRIRECAQWAAWGKWSACSKSCSQGERVRKRDCVVVHGATGHTCAGNDTDSQSCNLRACPVHGGWSPWQPWSNCSQTCGLGLKTRYRRCSNPYPQYGGDDCKGTKIEAVKCVTRLCIDDPEFTPWSNWSECSSACGQGFQSRKRTCKKKEPISGKNICLGSSEEYQACNGTRCHSVWGEWKPWSQCFGDCNQGQRFRFRFCVDDQGKTGYACGNNKSYELQRDGCQTHWCRYGPVWSGWSAWSECSRSCAVGTRRRWRYCVTKILGQPCPGNQESKSPCNVQPCPIHGGWSDWGEWSECSAVCGGGLKQRNRTCSNPTPNMYGRRCYGDVTDKALCNTRRCNDHIISDKLNRPDKTQEVTKREEIILRKPAECPIAEQPVNGKYTIRNQADHNKFLEYKCNDYYRNRGQSVIRYCADDGTWSGQPADCVLDCGEIKRTRKGEDKRKSIRNMQDFWPWQVAIEVPIGVHCGGTLIGDQWVLTAAHCVLEHDTLRYHKEIKVILGTHNLTDESSSEVQVIPVNKTRHHHDFQWDFNKMGVKSDIAILKLEKKVRISKNVHPVCLPRGKRRKQLVQAGRTGVFVGWGGTQEPHLLRQMPLPVVRRKECEQSYKRYNYKVTEKMICAGYKGNSDGLCKKDSGGGFYFLERTRSKRRHRRSSRWVLGGIASWRFHKCFQEDKYSVFTDVTKHLGWIINTMNNL